MSSLRWLPLLAALALTFVTAEKIPNYNGYHLLRVVPQNAQQVDMLASHRGDRELDFWQEPRGPGLPVDVFVSPKNLSKLKQTFLDAGLEYEVLMNDPQSFLDSQIETFASPKPFGWNDYQTLDAIHRWLKDQAQQHNKIATIITAGQSVEGRPLLGLRIAHKPNLPVVFVEAGIHAREWIAPATATWFIQQALNATDELVKSYEWHVFPSVNPDGYAYTQKDRLWKKSRRNFGSCVGVDLNANWPFQWRGSGDACADFYPGSKPASEPETQGLMTYLNSVASRTRVFISLQSYSQVLMYPWAYTNRKTEKNDEVTRVAAKAVDRLQKRYGTKYNHGTLFSFIANTFGTPIDYAYSLNISYTYVFDLRDKGSYGFLLPKEQIVPTALETFDGVSAILEEAQKSK